MKKKRSKKFQKKLDADLDSEEDYEVSESDDEFTPEQKILLDDRLKAKEKPSEEEVFAIHKSSDEDEDDDDYEEDKDGSSDEDDKYYGGGVGSDMDSDVEDKVSDDGLPDSKAWGSKRKHFYDTDYIDKDFGGMSKTEEELAEMEEEEAAAIQARLMSHLEETDFTMGLLEKVEEKKKESKKLDYKDLEKEKIVTDLSKLSKTEKIQLLKKESPEMFNLIDDFKDKIDFVVNKLSPIVEMISNNKLPRCRASNFVNVYYSTVINYCMNIVFYLMVKANRQQSLEDHPVISRLYSYKKVIDEMDNLLSDEFIAQLDTIISRQNSRYVPDPQSFNKNILVGNSAQRRQKKFELRDEANRRKAEARKKEEKLAASMEQDEDRLPSDFSDVDMEGLENVVEHRKEADDSELGNTKRSITYEMSKNKGLTPKRKKENRNPRVKNRNKFKKAMVRRKGQVRTVRTETRRYDGELSGIKAYLSKSVKLK